MRGRLFSKTFVFKRLIVPHLEESDSGLNNLRKLSLETQSPEMCRCGEYSEVVQCESQMTVYLSKIKS